MAGFLAGKRILVTGIITDSSIAFHIARVAQACRCAGALDQAAQAADRAVKVARSQRARVLESAAQLVRAEVTHSAGGRTDAAQEDLRAALLLAESCGAVSHVPFIQEELGRLLDDDARLRDAARLYAAMGASGHARRLEAELRS